jgi:hypothetical protein
VPARGRGAVHALDDRDLGAHPRDGLAELDADGTGAEDQQPAGHLPQAGRLAVGPDAVELAETRDRGDDRVRAGRDHDVAGEVGVVADDHASGAVEASRAAHDRDPRAVRPRRLAGIVVVADHEVAPRERGSGVHDAAVDGLCGARRLPRGLQRLARAHERLGRDAAPVGALPAEQLALDDRDAQAALGESRGAVLAGGPPPSTMTSKSALMRAPSPCRSRRRR